MKRLFALTAVFMATSLAAEIPIRTQVRLFPLAEANRALNALKDDEVRGAAVIQVAD